MGHQPLLGLMSNKRTTNLLGALILPPRITRSLNGSAPGRTEVGGAGGVFWGNRSCQRVFDQFTNAPNVIGDLDRRRRRATQGLVNSHEIVPRHVQRDGRPMEWAIFR